MRLSDDKKICRITSAFNIKSYILGLYIKIYVAKIMGRCYNHIAVLDGEPAVPCELQSAIAVSNTILGLCYGWLRSARSVDTKVPCNVIL